MKRFRYFRGKSFHLLDFKAMHNLDAWIALWASLDLRFPSCKSISRQVSVECLPTTCPQNRPLRLHGPLYIGEATFKYAAVPAKQLRECAFFKISQASSAVGSLAS